MSFYRTPYRLVKPQSARLRHYVTLGSLALSSAALGGCTQQPVSTGGEARSSTPSWSTVLQNWWQAGTDASQTVPAPTPAPPLGSPSQDEIARLARQHPAWKLADALQENRIGTLQFEAIRPDATPDSALARPNFDVQSSRRAGLPAPQPNSTLPPPATTLSDNAGATRVEFGDLHQAARDLQDASVSDFLQSVAVRQQDWQRDYRAILQVALGEDVEAAARRLPQVVPLVLPSPEVQLEMTNLRLRLLRNVFTTQEERAAARERLGELLLQWRAALREQEKARAQELERIRTQEPERIRREGLAGIEQELDIIQRSMQTLRSALAAEHKARLEEDFGNERARLVLAFPDSLPVGPAEESQAKGASPSFSGKTVLDQINFHRTPLPRRTSNTVLPGIASQPSGIATTREAQISALRKQAWIDATRQAKMSARLGY